MDHDDFAGMIAMLENCGLTKTTIARETGVSYATVWRMANGSCKTHLHDTVDRLEGLQRRSLLELVRK